ncbi:hypothetical protein [Cryobacterium aureum]|uniref:hypothetical protein n=1 Tax=Cryobacterium aureum TaxID=995037 RepID=UPI000CF42513|nr:hypothetical protein [Cryobacterium aureum]
MKLKMRILLATMSVAALTVGLALPASAADTTTTLAIENGTLSITVPNAAYMGSQPNTVGGSVVTASLGQVTVSDARPMNSAGASWTVNASATGFVASGQSTTIPASAIGYTVGTVTKVGSPSYIVTTTNLSSMATAAAVVAASSVYSSSSAAWNPTITIKVPSGMSAATYTSMITHSVF